jgi:hypothetical protein
MQARGKQTTTVSHGIIYTKVTGIWQTVWLERAGDPYLKSFRFIPAQDLRGGTFKLEIAGTKQCASAEVEISPWDGRRENAQRVPVRDGEALWFCNNPRPWSPEHPNLYRVSIILRDASAMVSDQVDSYVGIRTVQTNAGRVLLNGRDFYQKLVLDQGYFPGGLYTPRDDGAMKNDIEMFKRMGFNGLRKHQKIEDPRFLYWCDVSGLVVWEEMPSLGLGVPTDVPAEAKKRFREEWLQVIERDRNHPCIITWTIFNENWGIVPMPSRPPIREWAYDMVAKTRAADPTRPVVDNSGGWHFDTDIFDFHHYLPTVARARRLYDKYSQLMPGDHIGHSWYSLQAAGGSLIIPNFYPGVPYKGQPIILSEYGGFGFYPAHERKTFLELYEEYTLALRDYPFIVGYCYTQPYDVLQERNGLMTFEREPKLAPEDIKAINDQVGW